MVQISVFVLTSLSGVLVGALVYDSEGHDSVNARDVAGSGSQQEIVALTDEVESLRMMIEQDRRRIDDAAEDHDDYEEPDLEEIIARDRNIADRRAAVITTAAGREAVDRDWAPTVELQITEGLAAHGPPGATLVSAVCKTTLCIAEIEHAPDDDGSRHVNWLAVFGRSRGFFVRHEPEPGTGARTVAYLARDGYSLPRAEPSASRRRR